MWGLHLFFSFSSHRSRQGSCYPPPKIERRRGGKPTFGGPLQPAGFVRLGVTREHSSGGHVPSLGAGLPARGGSFPGWQSERCCSPAYASHTLAKSLCFITPLFFFLKLFFFFNSKVKFTQEKIP